ncbi:ABC transporter ATP-binding protein [Bifidobacterium callitrichos]|uniref:ABC transporter ATP-binding protein n=1 Tax=Bifidobacterium callitrichos TaxID=762209 RepID=A0A2T3G926_9BIFI|nr:ABC transporter permease [Bifidobacterium callitrichos]PST46000.1 ABC transporter ATP-binding protein [Bifidobacterium callitrichos]
MSGNAYDIDVWGLVVALAMVAVAAGVGGLMRMGIGRSLMWSACRALLQLCAMGFVVGYVIRADNVLLVFATIGVMLVAAVQITLSRAKGVPKGLAGPVLLSLTITMLLMIALVTELVVRPHPWYAPQLVVPLTGMLLGNTVSALAVGLSRFYESMDERRDEIDTMLALGATAWEAARPSIVSSIRLGLLPTMATLASCGIVTIPGMMAGQVIAGGDPLEAAKYQFVVFAAIASLTLVADGLIMAMVYRTCFTALDQFRSADMRGAR